MTTRRTLGGDPMDSRLVRRFGYRGAALLTLGIMWGLFGLSILANGDTPERSWVLHDLIPVPVRAALWIGAGLVGIIVGLRGPDHDDTLGMLALMLMPLERFASFAVSYVAYGATWLGHHATGAVEITGYRDGLLAASVWLLVVTLVRLVAGWPNPRRVLALPDGAGRDD